MPKFSDTKLSIALTLDPECGPAFKDVMERTGLSPGLTAKSLLAAVLAEPNLLSAIDREERRTAIYEYRQFVINRISYFLDELKDELIKEGQRLMLERETGSL